MGARLGYKESRERETADTRNKRVDIKSQFIGSTPGSFFINLH